MTAPVLDRADIQGDILRSYGNSYVRTAYVFLGVEDPARGRAWLSDRVDRVTTALPWNGAAPQTTLNMAFTCAGLKAMGVSQGVLDGFSAEFVAGMAARAAELGDSGENDPKHWQKHLGTGEAHVLVTLNARDDATLEGAVDDLRAGLEDVDGLSIVHEVDARLFPDMREHFGFADGGAQPAIEGVHEHNERGGGVLEPDGWRPLAAGEFILGYEDEESRSDRKRRLPSAPATPLGRSGTYMVWRKLEQHVFLFRKTVREAARLYQGGDEAKLLAKIVGRWPNGAPLMSYPDAQPPTFDPQAADANDFRYAGDPQGMTCPLGAHIRRSNPRDALGFDAKLSFRHRIIRRGMPYGPQLLADALEDDGEERGLVFVCFNASISRQFESIQRQWLNDGNSFHVGADSDFILGAPAGKMTIQGDPPFFLGPQRQFVTTRGGEYLFVPGITALAAIADGVTG